MRNGVRRGVLTGSRASRAFLHGEPFDEAPSSTRCLAYTTGTTVMGSHGRRVCEVTADTGDVDSEASSNLSHREAIDEPGINHAFGSVGKAATKV